MVKIETNEVTGGVIGGFVDMIVTVATGGLVEPSKCYETKITANDGTTYEGTGSSKEESHNNAMEAYSSSDSSSSDNDGGGCYLTKACVSSRGLPDNCLELNVLRDFRDNVLMKTSKGKSAVKDYYRFAPDVVASIDSRVDSKQIWDSVYKDISHAVNLVQKGDFNAAFDHYKNMSNNLQKIYLK